MSTERLETALNEVAALIKTETKSAVAEQK